MECKCFSSCYQFKRYFPNLTQGKQTMKEVCVEKGDKCVHMNTNARILTGYGAPSRQDSTYYSHNN